MGLLGVLRLSTFFGAWVVGAVIWPIALIAAYFHIFFPLYILLVYHSYRFVFPAKYWPAFKRAYNLNSDPYCKSQKFVFEEGAVVPKPDSRTLLAVSPHGILTLGFSFMLSSEEFFDCKIKWLAAEILQVLPFISDFGLWTDLASASKKSMLSLMKQGTNLAMIPGGFEEATLFERGRHRVCIKERKGFIKYSLQYGYKICPCYCFGEEFSYWQLSFGKSFRLWLNKFNLPGVLFVGKYFTFMPDNNMDFTVVVGKALDLPHIPEPTDDDVERYHAVYVKALTDLFDRNKEKYAQPGATLEVL